MYTVQFHLRKVQNGELNCGVRNGGCNLWERRLVSDGEETHRDFWGSDNLFLDLDGGYMSGSLCEVLSKCTLVA